jgi:hypothetical protein
MRGTSASLPPARKGRGSGARRSVLRLPARRAQSAPASGRDGGRRRLRRARHAPDPSRVAPLSWRHDLGRRRARVAAREGARDRRHGFLLAPGELTTRHRRRGNGDTRPGKSVGRRGGIGLDPAFTVHDREDSADLMNLMRHELGFSKTENRFPTKGTRAVGRWVTSGCRRATSGRQICCCGITQGGERRP